MLTADGSRKRLARLLERLDDPWEAIVICRPEHLLYFANFYPLPNSLNLHSASFLLVERDGPVTLFTDNWLASGEGGDPAAADDAAVDATEVTTWYDCRRPARARAAAVAAALCDRLRTLGVKHLAAELSALPVQVAGAADRIFDLEPTIAELREIKDVDELDAIRHGIRTAEAVHAASRELLEPGLSEIEYYGRLLGPATVAAGAPFVMMCDLASGPRAAAGGGPPTGRVLERGELVILDIFPYVGGYRGDITNTLAVGGQPASEDVEACDLVVAALEAGERMLASGAAVRDVCESIDAVFVAAGKPALPHHAGHAIGLGHPEAPEIVLESERLLETGMVVTLEPGIYGLPRGGIRLEHDYLITADGCERLSGHSLGLA